MCHCPVPVEASLRMYGDDTIKIGRVFTLVHGKGTGTQLMKYAISELNTKTGYRKMADNLANAFWHQAITAA